MSNSELIESKISDKDAQNIESKIKVENEALRSLLQLQKNAEQATDKIWQDTALEMQKVREQVRDTNELVKTATFRRS